MLASGSFSLSSLASPASVAELEFVRRCYAFSANMGLFSFLRGSSAKASPPVKQQPKPKQFKIRAEDMKPLIPDMGGGMASDHIMVDGQPVGYMFRESADHAANSGWVFMSGRESQAYADDPDNWAIYALNTIANYDPAIIPYLSLPIGTRLDRVPDTSTFQPVPTRTA